MNTARFRRVLTTLVLVGGAMLFAFATASATVVEVGSAHSYGLDALRAVRLLGLGLFLFFVLPLLLAIAPSLGRGERTWVDIRAQLRRLLLAIAVALVLSEGIELLVYGPQPAIWAFVCTLPFWLVVIGVVILVIVLASGESISVTMTSSTGGAAVFKEATNSVMDIDLSVTASSSDATHNPCTVKIDKIEISALPGAQGNVVTNVTAKAGIGGNGTGTATATGTGIGGFAQALTPGQSMVDVTVTATCAKGHSTTVTQQWPYTR
jgi:hypothetical protein